MNMLRAAKAIRAEERLERITDGQIAAGMAKSGSAQRHIRSLAKQAAEGQPEAPRRRSANVLADLATAGLQIVRVDE